MPLAAALLKAKIDNDLDLQNKTELHLLDFYLNNSEAEIILKIVKNNPDLVGFSTYLWNTKLVQKLAIKLKENYPHIKIFAGGAEASALPLNLLNSAPFDFVIKGEGELAFTKIINEIFHNHHSQSIAGVYKKDAAYRHPSPSSPVQNLEELPSPFLQNTIDVKKYPGVLWELSRGCGFKCDFCFESRGEVGVRRYSLDRIKQELIHFEKQQVNQVFVLDATFNQDKNRAKEILKLIIDIAPEIHFTFEVRSEFLDEEMAELFSQLNCGLQIGLQSAHPDVLAHVNRKFTPKQFIKKMNLLNEYGITFGLDLIYGLPTDTLAGFKQSLDYALNLQPNHLDIFPLVVLPGTALYDNADGFKLSYLKEAPYTVESTPHFNETNFKKARQLAKSVDIFYNQGGAVGWMFMVSETLNLKPSSLIDEFSHILNHFSHKNQFTKEEIHKLHLKFTEQIFAKHQKEKLFLVMQDIINYHHILQQSLLNSDQKKKKNDKKIDENTILNLALSTSLTFSNYHLNDLMMVGEFNLKEFVQFYKPNKCGVVTYKKNDCVTPIVIHDTWVNILNSFNGKLTLKQVLKKHPKINKNQLYEFLEYAYHEGFIY